MCLLNLSDEAGMIDVVVWHDLYTKSYSVLASSEGLRITGTVQENYGVYSMIAEKVEQANFSARVSHVTKRLPPSTLLYNNH